MSSSDCIQEYKDIMQNMHILHECKDSRDRDFANRIQQHRKPTLNMDSFSFSTDEKDIDDFDEMPASILDHLNLVEACFSEKRLLMKLNAMDCTKHAEAMNLFPLSRNILLIENDIPPVDLLEANSSNFEALWKTEYEDRKKMWKSKMCMSLDRNSHSNSHEHTLSSSTIIMQADASAPSQCQFSSLSTTSTVPSSAYIQPLLIASTSIDHDAIAKKWTLNSEQIKAFQITCSVHSLLLFECF